MAESRPTYTVLHPMDLRHIYVTATGGGQDPAWATFTELAAAAAEQYNPAPSVAALEQLAHETAEAYDDVEVGAESMRWPSWTDRPEED